jgi:hypothetical protein
MPIPRHAHLGPLPDDVPPESDPGPPAQLQAERGDLGDCAGDGRGQIRRLEHHHLDLGSTRQRRQSVQPLPQGGRGGARAARQGRQIQQQQVHRSVLEEQRRHRQRLLESVRREHDQPFERDSPSHRLDRIEAPREVQVSGYTPGGLNPGDGLQPESGLAARSVTLEGGGSGARQPAQPEDCIERTKAGRYRRVANRPRLVRMDRLDRGVAYRPRLVFLHRLRRNGQRPHDLGPSRWASYTPARSCPTPAIPEGRQSNLDFGGGGGHEI